MVNDIKKDAEDRMSKSVQALVEAFKKVRTGRANPAILDGVMVDYYGTPTQLPQVANSIVEDARSLAINPWEKSLVPAIEKAIMKSALEIGRASCRERV